MSDTKKNCYFQPCIPFALHEKVRNEIKKLEVNDIIEDNK